MGKKKLRCHKWQYKGRPLVIEQSIEGPKTNHFKGGIYVNFDKENYSVRAVSKVQKQLRQQLYFWLVDNGLNISNYILFIDCPEQPTGSKVYLELVICFEPGLIEIKDLESLCNKYLDKMILLFMCN